MDARVIPPSPGAEEPGRITPMMQQYVEIRAANPDCLLFYRMGDFYELFFDDAVIASRALGIALTKRGKHLGDDIAMCGVPVHAADDYLQKLIALGHRVAVCEQTEDPAAARKRGAKSVVRRAVTRLVTPGTITEERLLDAGRSNFLASLCASAASDGEASLALAWTDISTGAFELANVAADALPAFLARIEPREMLVPEKLAADAAIAGAIRESGAALTPLPAAFFDSGTAEARLAAFYGVRTMEAFGAFARAELSAGAALVAYVEKTQVATRPTLEPPRRSGRAETMRIDAATRANLELTRSLGGGRAGSLLAAIDRTVTAAGARLLAERIAAPLTDPARIAARLDAVEFYCARPVLREEVRRALAGAPDILRALARLGLERGGPRDLAMIAAGLDAAAAIAMLLSSEASGDAAQLAGIAVASPPEGVAARLGAALADELPLLKRDGNFVRPAHAAELDEARALRDESRRVIAALQGRYAAETGIRGLRIKHNNVLGYFVEVNAAQAPALQGSADGARFIHRQTMAGAMRFTTAELGELEQKIASAADRALAIELGIFDELAQLVAANDPAIRAVARSLAEIDVASALAELAAKESYVRPRIDASTAFRIEGGRHPVVEQALRASGESFVGNACDLGPSADSEDEAGRIWLLTGPNMAGKSTFLRQNALIAILVQAGSFVPARSAHIGIVDALFSRVGAADDLARGRSTFMVEMVESAAILNQAGPRSLVILDEMGRGTATFDGLSLAWAAIEHLSAVNRSRALFATHYHELTALAARLPRLVNATMSVKEWKGEVIFLHEVAPGAADRSYGIQVAKLAGLPASVIARARMVLSLLEKGERGKPVSIIDDLPLFAAAALREPEPPHPALAALEALDPDELSPKDALEQLYALKRLASKSGPGSD